MAYVAFAIIVRSSIWSDLDIVEVSEGSLPPSHILSISVRTQSHSAMTCSSAYWKITNLHSVHVYTSSASNETAEVSPGVLHLSCSHTSRNISLGIEGWKAMHVDFLRRYTITPGDVHLNDYNLIRCICEYL